MWEKIKEASGPVSRIASVISCVIIATSEQLPGWLAATGVWTALAIAAVIASWLLLRLTRGIISYIQSRVKSRRQLRLNDKEFAFRLLGGLSKMRSIRYWPRMTTKELLKLFARQESLPKKLNKIRDLLVRLNKSSDSRFFKILYDELGDDDAAIERLDNLLKFRKKEDAVRKIWDSLKDQYNNLQGGILKVIEDSPGDWEVGHSFNQRGYLSDEIRQVLASAHKRHAGSLGVGGYCEDFVIKPEQDGNTIWYITDVEARLGKFVFDFFEEPLQDFCRKSFVK
jgi:hypothetical protein